MAAPKFDWQGSTEGPEGVAKFCVGSHCVEVHFKAFMEASSLNNLIREAHAEGAIDGQRIMRRYMESALNDSQGRWW